MHIMYVDESGDAGVGEYSSPHYILSGLIISQTDWSKSLSLLKSFRKILKDTYGLRYRDEIHANELIRINKIDSYRKIRKSDRISILKLYAKQIPSMFYNGKIINVCLDKSQFIGTDIQALAWQRLVQAYNTYLEHTVADKGIIVSDDTDGNKISAVLREMKKNHLLISASSEQPMALPESAIIEDLFQRSSHTSYFIQSVDVISHLLYRMEYPKGSLKKYGLEHIFTALAPLLLKDAHGDDVYGIIRK